MYSLALQLMLPEIIISTMACLVLLVHLYFGKGRAWLLLLLALGALLAAGYYSLQLYAIPKTTIFKDTFILDNFSTNLKLVIYACVLLNFIYASKYVLTNFTFVGEYFSLVLFSTLGMMILVSSNNFLSLYLGLELFVLPIYALIAITKQYESSAEAAIKYFVMGAMASAILLYGVTLLYGVSGSLEFPIIAEKFLHQAASEKLILQFGMIFILTGIAFKLGAVPFHMWLPDVYQGAPLPITMFIGTASKLAAFGMAIRVLSNVFLNGPSDWQMLLSFMAILSLLLGNLAALQQIYFKRLLAYSAIANIGFILLGIIVVPKYGITPSMFYVLSYVLAVIAVFGLIAVLGKQGFEIEKINNLKGLAKKAPYISFLLLIALLSLASIPLTVGFYAKFFILNSLIELGEIKLAIFALVMSVIGAYYYLKIIKVIYFDTEEDPQAIPEIKISTASYMLLSANSFAVVIFGILPGPILAFCAKALLY